jgi:glycosyltransferase involved in cell wall biosynthesis
MRARDDFDPAGPATRSKRAHNIPAVSGARILNLIDMAPNKRGPVELQVLETARQAVERGMHFAAYFTSAIPSWFDAEMTAAGAQVATFDRSRWTAEVTAVCDRERPNLAHFQFGPHAGMSEVSRRGVKVVRSEHSPRPRRSLGPLRTPIRHWRTRGVDLFIAVSEFIAAQTTRDFGVRRSRIRVVMNATDTSRFRPRPADKQRLRDELLRLRSEHVVITVAANMRPAKRQELAILAMPELLRAAPDARLVLAGDGPDRQRLWAMVKAQGLEDAVTILHGDNDVAAIYAASDIALLPSISEGLPGGGVEALACGLPLVATPNGGTPEVYEDGVSGVSVHDQTSRGLANALLPLARDQALREAMGRAARARAEALFPISRAARETLAVYDELL